MSWFSTACWSSGFTPSDHHQYVIVGDMRQFEIPKRRKRMESFPFLFQIVSQVFKIYQDVSGKRLWTQRLFKSQIYHL